jgi:2-isopropylmalate synthase
VATKFSTNLKKLLYKSNSKGNYSEFNNALSSDIEKIVKNHNQSKNIEFYDTTLRDGNQAVGINFSVEDKLKIARRLSDFGIDLIEGGWPSEANSSEIAFFRNLKNEKLDVPISAIGATRKPNSRTEKDQNLIDLLSVNTDYTTIVGKSWKLHVEKVLETTEKENLRMIADSIDHLRDKGRKVFFDAEHFFDGYKEDKEYALRTLEKAAESGVKKVVLCDTRGNSLPSEVFEVTRNVKNRIKVSIGIHAHNDKGLALANSLFAILAGADHFQGTVNGIGERCGNANLIEFVANLELSLGYNTGLDLTKLTRLSDYVFEIANLNRNNYMPFVGRYAFAHKAGLHGHAVLKFPKAYESIDPSLVGNARMISISSQAGLANIVSRAKEFGFQLDRSDQKAKSLLWKIKEMEAKGYNFENANATLHLLYAKTLGDELNYFDLVNWRAFVTGESGNVRAECSVKLMVNQETLITAGEGNGPVNAFDVALKKALQVYYPELTKVRLIGYRVREIDVEKGTAAAVRVFIEFEAEGIRWSTVGVSPNVLKASEEALVDGYVYFLYRRGSKKKNIQSS